MSNRALRFAVLLGLAVSTVDGGHFSLHDYLQKRFHPESVQERDVEGLDQRIENGKLSST